MERANSLKTVILFLICLAILMSLDISCQGNIEKEFLKLIPSTIVLQDNVDLYENINIIASILQNSKLDKIESNYIWKVFKYNDYILRVSDEKGDYKSVYGYPLSCIFSLYKKVNWVGTLNIVENKSNLPSVVFRMDLGNSMIKEILYFEDGRVKYIKRIFKVTETKEKIGNEILPQTKWELVKEESSLY